MSLDEIRLEGNALDPTNVPPEYISKGTMPLLEYLYTKLNESQDIFREFLFMPYVILIWVLMLML